jgi:SET domain-containing protein
MAIKVKTKVCPSSIHGNGLFAEQDIRLGDLIWEFGCCDSRIPIDEATLEQKHFGYVNNANPSWLVICGDESRFMNFSDNPNCGFNWLESANAESPLFAKRDILAGEELTVGVETDADSARKLSL